jgi:hypothetical protein
VKLKNHAMAQDKVKAHGQQGGDENHRNNIGVKPWKYWRQNEQNNKDTHYGPQ